MIAGMLITIREGLEAFLITGILLGYLRKVGRPALSRYVWAGTIVGVLASIGLTMIFQRLAVEFEGHRAALFEATASAIAVPILSYMVLYMQRQSHKLKGEAEVKAELAISTGQVLALGTLAFITVLREGLETALFLTALTTRVSGGGLMPGAILGLVLAAAIAYTIFASTIRLNLRRFFIEPASCSFSSQPACARTSSWPSTKPAFISLGRPPGAPKRSWIARASSAGCSTPSWGITMNRP